MAYDIVAELRGAAKDDRLGISSAWNLLDKAADEIVKLEDRIERAKGMIDANAYQTAVSILNGDSELGDGLVERVDFLLVFDQCLGGHIGCLLRGLDGGSGLLKLLGHGRRTLRSLRLSLLLGGLHRAANDLFGLLR